MSAVPTKQIDGDVAVGRNVTAGGDARVLGSATVEHGLKVGGWLDAPNVKGAQKGMFLSAEDLRKAYPLPEPGWWALVGDRLPAEVWLEEDGNWVTYGGTSGEMLLDAQGALVIVEQLRTALNRDLATDVTFAAQPTDVKMGVEVANPVAGTTGEKCTQMPMAGPKQAGFMSAAQAEQLQRQQSVFGNYAGTRVLTDAVRLSGRQVDGLELTLETYDLGDELAHQEDSPFGTSSLVLPAATPKGNGVMTAAQAAALAELASGAALRPLYIAAGARYNAATGFYELNGLTDITEAEMVKIYMVSPWLFSNGTNVNWNAAGFSIRTNLFPWHRWVGGVVNGYMATVDVFNVGKDTLSVEKGWIPKTKRILGAVQVVPTTKFEWTDQTVLEHIELKCTANASSYVFDLRNAALLDDESVQYMIDNRVKGSAIASIVLHPDVFARLTAEQIATAAARNLSFVEA